MSRTNDLRCLVQSMLKASDFINKHGIKEVYYKKADNNKLYPHIVFNIRTINLGDINRKDYILSIDVYTKEDEKLVKDIADDIENMFNNVNSPKETILPTFFLNRRDEVPDEDQRIQHEVINVQTQLYEKEVAING